jgi:hypothetical protein
MLKQLQKCFGNSFRTDWYKHAGDSSASLFRISLIIFQEIFQQYQGTAATFYQIVF